MIEKKLSNTEMAYMTCAKNVSKLSNHPKYPIGCVIVKGHRIISSGYNSDTKTQPLQATIDSSYFGCNCTGKMHAETSALIYFIKRHIDISGATLYTYRERRDGRGLGLARPCHRCMKLINLMGIKKIVYSTNGGYASEKI